MIGLKRIVFNSWYILFLICILSGYNYLYANTDTYGPYNVYVGSSNNKLTIKTTNNAQGGGEIENISLIEKSKPDFVNSRSLPPSTTISNTANSTVDMVTTFDISNDYKQYAGKSGTLKLTWNADNECMVDWPDKNTQPWDVDIKLNVQDLFTVTCSPPNQSIKDGETKSHTITVNSLHQEESVNFQVTVSGGGAGWTVNGTSWNFSIGPNGSQSQTFSVSNSGATSDLNLSIQVTAQDFNVTKSPENLDNAENPGHVTDHPDDNFSVSSAEYPTDWIYDSKSPVGVLASGWGEGLNYLLGKFNIATTVVRTDLTILNEPDKNINDLDVLVIGSAGLAGLESSPTFRNTIADYVAQGGVLINLTAKNGCEFVALPGGEVAGYGWNEDQSCLSAAVSIVKYHQMLSGQTSTNLNVNVDGYFTKWPENTEVLLQRNKNGMPALITYPYGNGRVIATTIFEDWAYGQYQSTPSGQTLIRDMVAWARKAATVPEFSMNSSVSFPVRVINTTSTTAQKVLFTTFDPYRKTVNQQTVTVSIPNDDTVTVDYFYEVNSEQLGVWYVEYTLLDADDDTLPQKRLGELFVISNPVGVAKIPDITFGVNSDAENYAKGSEGVFTITVWNHTDSTRHITAWWSFPHNYWDRHEDVYGSPGITAPYNRSNLKEILEVPAYDHTSFTYSVPLYIYDRLWAQFSDENNRVLGTASRGFYCFEPLCEVKAATDKQQYRPGDEVTIDLSVKNVHDLAFKGEFTVTVLSPDNVKIWENSTSIDVPSQETVSNNHTFTLPTESVHGVYTVKAEVIKNGFRSGSYSAHFVLPEAYLALTPQLPGILQEGDNALSFAIENYELVGVSSGELEANLYGSNGSVIWTETKPFTLEGGLTASVDFTMPISTVEFGTYQLTYRAHYNGLYSKMAYKKIPSTCIISSSTDKNIYQIRETAIHDISIINNGMFRYDNLTCTITLPGCNDVTSTISLKPSQNNQVSVSHILAETLTSGSHVGTITVSLPSGSNVSKNFYIVIPPSDIVVTVDSEIDQSMTNIPVSTKNNGGVDAQGTCSLSIKDRDGFIIFEQEWLLSLMAGEKKTNSVQLPQGVVDGVYELTATVFNTTEDDTTIITKQFDIQGNAASLDAFTDKRLYSQEETGTASGDISVVKGTITQGSIELKAKGIFAKTKQWSTQEDWEQAVSSSADYITSSGDVIGSCSSPIDDQSEAVIGHWNFEESDGTTVRDVTGNGHDGILVNSSRVEGISGNALYVSGSNSYAEVPYNAALDVPGSFSISVWAKSNVSGNSYYDEGFILNMGSGAEYDYAISFHPTPQSIGVRYNQATMYIPNSVSDITQWHHYVLTFNGTVQKLYLDGVIYDSLPVGIGSISNLPLRFGAQSKYLGRYWNGLIDEILFMNRPLEASEIDKLYKCSQQSSIVMEYDAGSSVLWKSIQATTTLPEGTSIAYSLRTAETKGGLQQAQWVACDNETGFVTTLSKGTWAQLKATFYAGDPDGEKAVLHDMTVHYDELGEIWSDVQSVETSGELSVTTTMDAFADTGSFILEGRLQSRIGQNIAYDEYRFDVDNHALRLTYDTDKNVYKPGELITVNGFVSNGNSEDITVSFSFNLDDSTEIYTNTVVIPATSEYSFTFTFTAPTVNFLLSNTIDGRNNTRFIMVEVPELSTEMIVPSIVGYKPFDCIVRLTNDKLVEADVTVTIGGESFQVVVPPHRSEKIVKTMSLTSSTMVEAVISGDVDATLQKVVNFGEYIWVSVIPAAVYPEGVVVIPYIIYNYGNLDSDGDITFVINDQTVTKSYFAPAHQNIQSELVLNQVAGSYTIDYQFHTNSGHGEYSVSKEDQIAMDLKVSRYTPPKVLILRDNYTEKILQPLLEAAGMQVSLSTNLFPWWDGTNPTLDGFDVVILPMASYYYYDMPVEAQHALVSYVNNGGGFITSEWVMYSIKTYGTLSSMSDLILYEPSQWNIVSGAQTFTKIVDHPITENLPVTFSTTYNHYSNTGGLKAGATSIVNGSVASSAVAVKQYGEGRIVHFALDGNALSRMSQTEEPMRTLLLDAIIWAGKSREGNELQAQITVANNGFNAFEGQLSSTTSFFTRTEDLSLASGEIATKNYKLDLTSVETGLYQFTSRVLYGGKALQQATGTFVIGSPEIELTAVPTDNNFTPGQQITSTFGIRNSGIVEGKAELALTFNELFDGTRSTWIAPGIEKLESFTVEIPDDYPDGEYRAQFSLNGNVTEIPFTVSGVKLSVVASLDKTFYESGETATLTLDITNESDQTPVVFAKAVSVDETDREDFTLDASQTIELHIPVSDATASQIAYGIYRESGRAIYLNTTYIRTKRGPVTLYTDKSVYRVGETVTVKVRSDETGDCAATTSTGYSVTVPVTAHETAQFSFTLPEALVSGTQTISYILGENSGECKFDVQGYSLRIKDVTSNKETFDPIDQIATHMTVVSNDALSGVIKGWLYTPDKSYTELFEVVRDLNDGETDIEITATMSTTVAGTHKLVYGIYSSGTNLMLVTGSKYFDVRPTAIISVSTDNEIHSELDEPLVMVQTYSCEPYNGAIEIVNEYGSMVTRNVSLDGAGNYDIMIGPLPTGDYHYSARLRRDGVTASEKPFDLTIADLSAPSAPEGLTLSMDGAVANLIWNPNGETDLAGYNMYRNNEKCNAVPLKIINYRDERMVAGVSYTYHITAVDLTGNESAPSLSVVAMVDNIAPVITMSPSGNITSETPVTLEYSVTDDIDPSPVIQASHASGTTFTDDNEYVVSIVATDAHHNSTRKKLTIVIESGPPEPVTLTAFDAKVSATVQLDWSGYIEVSDLVSYAVYQSDNSFSTVEGMTPIASLNSGVFEYRVTGLADGTRYYFAIVAFDRLGNVNEHVSAVSVIPTDGKGAVKVVSTPEHATVFLAGTYGYLGSYQGTTPLKIADISEGKYFLQVKSDGYETYQTIADITAGDTITIDCPLQQSTGFGYMASSRIQVAGTDLNFGTESKPVVIDYDLDGKKDLIGIDAENKLVFFKNIGTDEAPEFTLPAVDLFDCSQSDHACCPVDFNNDLRIDIIIGKKDGTIDLLINTGTTAVPQYTTADRIVLAAKVSENAIPAVVDWNGDGMKDLLIGDGTGTVKVFLNIGTDDAPLFTSDPDATPLLLASGNAAPFVVTDWNRDGLFDIVTGEQNGCLNVFSNTGTTGAPAFGPAKPIKGSDGQICSGSNAVPFVVDWTNDGLKDLVIGNSEGYLTLFTAVPNVPPIVDAGLNITIPSNEILSTVIMGSATDENEEDALSFRWREGDKVLTEWSPVVDNQCPLALENIGMNIGSHQLTLEVNDGLATSLDNMLLVIENSIPSVVATGAGVYEIYTDVTIGGTVADYDGDMVHYKWYNGETLLFEGDVWPAAGGEPIDLPDYVMHTLPLGTYILTLVVTDNINGDVKSEIVVTIVDTTVPTLAPSSSINMLWPPNHTMRKVFIACNVHDNSGNVTISAVISSNEPQDGCGDGDMYPDWTDITIDQQNGTISFALRAERSGTGDGRIYTIRITATDDSNNNSSADVKIVVPHSKNDY